MPILSTKGGASSSGFGGIGTSASGGSSALVTPATWTSDTKDERMGSAGSNLLAQYNPGSPQASSTFTNGWQVWTVDADGSYTFTLTGATGAEAYGSKQRRSRHTGTADLIAGQEVAIMCGKSGRGNSQGAGGGGATAVALNGSWLIMVGGMGGEGGYSSTSNNTPNSWSSYTTSGRSSTYGGDATFYSSPGSGGNGGAGGGAANAHMPGGGGGGVNGAGARNTSQWGGGNGGYGGDQLTIKGVCGGGRDENGNDDRNGGFGGGGGGSIGGGGGGGYSGGGGGGWASNSYGTGGGEGGSYRSGSITGASWDTDGTNITASSGTVRIQQNQ